MVCSTFALLATPCGHHYSAPCPLSCPKYCNRTNTWCATTVFCFRLRTLPLMRLSILQANLGITMHTYSVYRFKFSVRRGENLVSPNQNNQSLTSSDGTTMSWTTRIFLCAFWRSNNLIIETYDQQCNEYIQIQRAEVVSLKYRWRTSRTVVWSSEPSLSLTSKVFMAKWWPSSSNTLTGFNCVVVSISTLEI